MQLQETSPPRAISACAMICTFAVSSGVTPAKSHGSLVNILQIDQKTKTRNLEVDSIPKGDTDEPPPHGAIHRPDYWVSSSLINSLPHDTTSLVRSPSLFCERKRMTLRDFSYVIGSLDLYEELNVHGIGLLFVNEYLCLQCGKSTISGCPLIRERLSVMSMPRKVYAKS